MNGSGEGKSAGDSEGVISQVAEASKCMPERGVPWCCCGGGRHQRRLPWQRGRVEDGGGAAMARVYTHPWELLVW